MATNGDRGGLEYIAPSVWRHGEKHEPTEKRESARMKHGDAARAYNVHRIEAHVDTDRRGYEASLLDLSAGGAAVLLAMPLPMTLPVTLRLKLGERLIEARGQVRYRSKLGGRYRIGVQFTELAPEHEALLQLLYGPGVAFEEADEL